MLCMDDRVTIRPGRTGDDDALYRLLDASIVWMVERGQSEQWGTERASENASWQGQIFEMAR